MAASRWTLPADPTAPAAARRHVRRELTGLPDEVVELAALLTDEVVTNAVVHGEGGPELTVITDGRWVRVAVSDVATRQPTMRTPSAGTEDGRGLTILDALAERWGVEPRRPGKTVWFELATRT